MVLGWFSWFLPPDVRVIMLTTRFSRHSPSIMVFQGSIMVFHNFWLVFMVFQGSFMVFHGSWLVSMVFQGSFMVVHGFWLVSLVFQGSFMVFGWFPWFLT